MSNNIYAERKMALEEREVYDFLKRMGGYCKLDFLKAIVSSDAIRRMIYEGKIFRVATRLRGNARFASEKIFKKFYYGYVWICSSRTAIVRLMFDALKEPDSLHTQKILSRYLKNYLTDAERIAVLWKLGIRNFSPSQMKSTIQISGIPPRKKSIMKAKGSLKR